MREDAFSALASTLCPSLKCGLSAESWLYAAHSLSKLRAFGDADQTDPTGSSPEVGRGASRGSCSSCEVGQVEGGMVRVSDCGVVRGRWFMGRFDVLTFVSQYSVTLQASPGCEKPAEGVQDDAGWTTPISSRSR